MIKMNLIRFLERRALTIIYDSTVIISEEIRKIAAETWKRW